MPQDAYTLYYLCDELNNIFKGGKINRIITPTLDEVVFTVYTGKNTEKLYISASPSNPRIAVGDSNCDAPLTAPNFCMLLRKHLLSATIDSVSLIDFDRIVKIDFTASSEFFDAGKKTLYVELMGRYSNVILCENDKVLGANRGINFFDNGVRPLIVGHKYQFPPNADKKTPKDNSLTFDFNGNKEKLSKDLCEKVQGISTQTAKEIVEAYFKSNNEFDNIKFTIFIKTFVYSSSVVPCVISSEKGEELCVYPYKTINGSVKKFESLLLAESFFFDNKTRLREFKNANERLLSLVNSAIKKVKKKLSAILSREKEALNFSENKLKGDLILSYVYLIKQGQKDCALIDYETGNEVKIELDENLTPAKNAERYYKKYNKQKRTLEALAGQKEFAEKELNYLESVLDEIALAETIEDLTLINEELIDAGLVKIQRAGSNKKIKERKYRLYEIDGFIVKVGRNNKENDEVTFSARQGDLWLHSKLYHSSHAVIESSGRVIPENVIKTVAEIVAYYSKARDGGKTEIVVADRKYVKKPTGAKLGFCTYTNFSSVLVSPSSHVEFIKTR